MKQQPKRIGLSTGGLASNVPHLHAIGTQLKPLQLKKKHGVDWIGEYEDKFELPRSTLYEAIKLAIFFPGKWLEKLEGLEWAKVRVLLKVVDYKTRMALMQRAIKEGWSVQRLYKEKVRKQGRRRARGGRDRSVDLHTDLARLTQRTRQWCRFVDTVWQDGTIGYMSQNFPEEGRLFSLLGRAKAVMRQLMERLEKRRLAPES